MEQLGESCSADMAQNIVDAFAAVGVDDLDGMEGDGGAPIMTVTLDYGGNILYAEMGLYHGPATPDPDNPDWDEDITADDDPDWYENTDWEAVNDIYSGDVRLYENGAPVAQVADVLLTRDQAICLYVCLEDDVTPYLYFPDTATFPAFSMEDGSITITRDGDSAYSVRSYFDAGNSLGQIVRTWYTAHYLWDGVPGSIPSCTGIEIEE